MNLDNQTVMRFAELANTINSADNDLSVLLTVGSYSMIFAVSVGTSQLETVSILQKDPEEEPEEIAEIYTDLCKYKHYQNSEDFTMMTPDQVRDSMAAYYEKHGTQGEF